MARPSEEGQDALDLSDGRRRARFSVGHVFAARDADGPPARAGLLVVGEMHVSPGPFRRLLVAMAAEATWLRARFALAGRPARVGYAVADAGELRVDVSNPWDEGPPRLEIVVVGLSWELGVLRRGLLTCVVREEVETGGGTIDPAALTRRVDWPAGQRRETTRRVRGAAGGPP